VLNEIEHSIEIEEAGFREIIEGSGVSLEEIKARAPDNWYVTCEKAKELRLIAGII
jgi:NADH pyrophosphatase NudC (nudix superfamily)